ncbi:Muc3 [Sigmodon hispidus]
MLSFSSTRMCARSRLLSLAVNCLHGGSWTGQICLCPNGYSGDRCQDRVPVVICQNGGSWNGTKCQCTSLFYGPRCEEVVDSIEVEQEIIASVEVTVTVTSENYSKELEDPKSEEFKKFNETFTKQMARIYEGIPEYNGVIIKSLRKGSIIVDYDVILKAKYTSDYENKLQNITDNVKEKIQNATKHQVTVNDSCSALLCFNSSATKVQEVNVTVNPLETCRKEAGEDFAAYVLLEYKDNKLHCITRCSSGYEASLDCHYGKCQLQRSGPQCLCLTTDTHWYSGETCDWGIQKSLVYGLVGAGVAVLLVILVILSVISIRFKRQANRERSRVSQMQKWNEEEGRAPGAFHNVGFDHSEDPDSEAPGSHDIIVNTSMEAVSHGSVELRTEEENPTGSNIAEHTSPFPEGAH